MLQAEHKTVESQQKEETHEEAKDTVQRNNYPEYNFPKDNDEQKSSNMNPTPAIVPENKLEKSVEAPKSESANEAFVGQNEAK